ncbi:WD40-like Beta Propeller Repeat [Pedobacter westerhofensis]|uniref:WD40-like Beta Propeller Repeat n=1 Tax=Pedobacter westerhofensis TaxID=425512 RepID=A0A521EX41_9SPHI|nr:PD40 domain-containing protein [Pedobacter westerhofensis]SMO88453.1 WD40-like Beta Propeller Repeat [Pedobacter westerhofensis]
MQFKIHYRILILSILILVTSILISDTAQAQVYDSEQNPFSVKWREINTSGFRIIYPVELETEAQRMANTIPGIFGRVGGSLGVKKARVPIILQNRGVIANGFVQLAPKKSEFFTTPPQSFDSQDWLNNLAVHELRHVAQFDKLTGGKEHPFPEEAYFAWMGVSLPLWFFEGDAVSTETSLTNVGRGRQPSWIMPYRTAILNGKNYSYSKSAFGSEKDVTPGYYQLGYLMISTLREHAGKYIIDSLLTDIKKRPVRLYPLAGSMKKYTGKTAKQWYDSLTVKLRNDWQIQAGLTPSVSYPSLNSEAKFATNYYLPAKMPDGKILALKDSKAETAVLVLIDQDKNEHRLLRIGQQEQPWFSYANGKAVWDEVRYDGRFLRRSFSVICSYDLKSGKVKKLTSRSRIFSPTLSADGTKIVAVSIDLSNKVSMIVLDAENGRILRSFPNPENLLIQTPSFSSDGSMITYVSVSELGKAIWTVDQNGKTRKIISETPQQLSRPVFIDRNIAFNAHYSGIDNIYNVDINSGKISALSASKYGAFNPTKIPGTDSILFNNFNLYGYEISKTRIEPADAGKNNFVFFGAAAAKQENTGNVFDVVPDSTFNSSSYKRLGHLLHFHSISPQVEDEYLFGLRLKSNNLLNTFDTQLGVDYHRDLGRVEYNAGISFKSLYPIFNLTYNNRPRRFFYETNNGTQQGDFRENYYRLNVQVPLTLTAQNHFFDFSVDAGTSYTQRYDAASMPANFIKKLSFPLETGFSFTHSIRTAERDIAPKWAQVLRFTYLTQPFDNKLAGNLFAAEGFAYFPGFARNHTFLANFNYQETSGIWIYNAAINTVYGYNNIRAKDKLRNTLLLNYRFPIAFPDAEIGPLAYITNVRGGVFCHYENIGQGTKLSQPKTYGFELHSNMNILRYSPVLDVGTRIVFVNQEYNQNPIFEVMLNYTF